MSGVYNAHLRAHLTVSVYSGQERNGTPSLGTKNRIKHIWAPNAWFPGFPVGMHAPLCSLFKCAALRG